MKKVVNKWRSLIICSLIIVPAIVLGRGPDDPPDDVNDVPFDGGVSLLVAAGIGYGMKKVYDKRKEAKDDAVIEK